MENDANPYRSPDETETPSPDSEVTPAKKHSPWAAMLWNMFVPGMGFAHLEMHTLGWLNFFGIFVILAVRQLMKLPAESDTLYFGYWIVSAVAVVVLGYRRNNQIDAGLAAEHAASTGTP